MQSEQILIETSRTHRRRLGAALAFGGAAAISAAMRRRRFMI